MVYSIRKKYTSVVISCVLHAFLLFVLLYTKLYHSQDDFQFIPQHQPAKVSMQLPGTQVQPSQAQPAPQRPPTPIPTRSQEEPTLGQSTVTQSITPAQFMQAFNAAIRTQRGEAYTNEGSQDSQIPLHVQKRLQQWGQLSYRQRIAEAFLKAGALLSRTINTSKPIKTVTYLSIPILKNGSLGDMSQNRLSGILEVDRYIIDVLTSANFPPIPDRFKTDTFLLTVPINVSLRPGTGIYNISVS